ncbi:thermonuclease family protein [Sporosarcina sp. FSL K6-3457]|uniref:thermonuclease family protein n=1 Tax=Sporosarcina sp. FSL K6-3457 TaxID=2978204 RepID=UPI0030FB59AB
MAKKAKKNNMSNILKSVGLLIVIAIGAIYFPELFAEEENVPNAQENVQVEASAPSGEEVIQKEDTIPGRGELIPVELVKTIDGDTIKIKYEGKEQNVRYLLIDTPETNHAQLGKQPFGQQAKDRNTQLMNSGKLEIEFDIGEQVDKYGRLLAYIYIDGVSIQEKLLEEGLARVGYVYPPNTRHLDAFEKAQEKAKKAGIGIWTLEDYVTERGFDSKKYPEGK